MGMLISMSKTNSIPKALSRRRFIVTFCPWDAGLSSGFRSERNQPLFLRLNHQERHIRLVSNGVDGAAEKEVANQPVPVARHRD